MHWQKASVTAYHCAKKKVPFCEEKKNAANHRLNAIGLASGINLPAILRVFFIPRAVIKGGQI